MVCAFSGASWAFAVRRKLRPTPRARASYLRTAKCHPRLEDDVDIDRDLFERLGEVWGYLPPAWDMLYLGTVIQSAVVTGCGRVLRPLEHRTLLVERDRH